MSVKSLRLALLAFLVGPSIGFSAECPVSYAATAHKPADLSELAAAIRRAVKLENDTGRGIQVYRLEPSQALEMAKVGRMEGWSAEKISEYFKHISRRILPYIDHDKVIDVLKMASYHNVSPVELIDELKWIQKEVAEAGKSWRREIQPWAMKAPSLEDAQQLWKLAKANNWTNEKVIEEYNTVGRGIPGKSRSVERILAQLPSQGGARSQALEKLFSDTAAKYGVSTQQLQDEVRTLRGLEAKVGIDRSVRPSRPMTESPSFGQAMDLWGIARSRGWTQEQLATAFNKAATLSENQNRFRSMDEVMAQVKANRKDTGEKLVLLPGEKPRIISELEAFTRKELDLSAGDDPDLILKHAQDKGVPPHWLVRELKDIRRAQPLVKGPKGSEYVSTNPTYSESLELWNLAKERNWSQAELSFKMHFVARDVDTGDSEASSIREIIQKLKKIGPDPAGVTRPSARERALADEAKYGRESPFPAQKTAREAEGQNRNAVVADFDPASSGDLQSAITNPVRGIPFRLAMSEFDSSAMQLGESLDTLVRMPIQVGIEHTGMRKGEPVIEYLKPEDALSLWRTAMNRGWSEDRLRFAITEASRIEATQNRFPSIQEVVASVVENRGKDSALMRHMDAKRNKRHKRRPGRNRVRDQRKAVAAELERKLAEAKANGIPNDEAAQRLGYSSKDIALLSIGAGWNPTYAKNMEATVAQQLRTDKPAEVYSVLVNAARHDIPPHSLGQDLAQLRRIETLVPNGAGVRERVAPTVDQALRMWEIGRGKKWSQEKLQDVYIKLGTTDQNRTRYLTVDELIVLLERVN